MKRGIVFLLFVFFMTSFASAEILMNFQPKEVYNFGDSFSIPVTIKSLNAVSGSFEMDLICNGKDINFYKNGVNLVAGEEKLMNPSLVLAKNLIGETTGDCKIKAKLGTEYLLTKDFKISKLVNLRITSENTEFNPGDVINIKGEAIKENGREAEGFIDVSIYIDVSNSTATNLTASGTINDGFFSIDFELPEDTRAGTHAVILNAYEKNSEGLKTNTGFHTYNIRVNQIPKNLELIVEPSEVEPGSDVLIEAILRDQTGEKIEANSIVTVKNNKDEIQDQQEIEYSRSLVLSVDKTEPAAKWKIFAVSSKITSEINFEILEKEDVEVQIINKTLIITNSGNVPYNKSILVKIGEENVNIKTYLDVGEEKKYLLKAPDGEYDIEVISSDGESKISQSALLTGNAIDIREASAGVGAVMRHPIVWIFLIFVLSFVAFMVLKKGYKKTFFGKISFKKKGNPQLKPVPLTKKSLVTTSSKAELSLSIKGDKQNTNLVCLKIKNLEEIQSKKGNAGETLQKIVNYAESLKSAVYENSNNLFFILAPVKTRTFDNEKTALNLAEKAKEILDNHNRMFKQKIDYGISLNYGAIVAKQEENFMKFMSMGTFITIAKKIAMVSKGEILLSESIKEKLGGKIKVERLNNKDLKAYTIKEIRGKEDHTRFINNFVKKLEKENAERKEKSK